MVKGKNHFQTQTQIQKHTHSKKGIATLVVYLRNYGELNSKLNRRRKQKNQLYPNFIHSLTHNKHTQTFLITN